MRVGSMRDGGKEICIDKKYKPRNPCLVYSFGSNYDFEFEKHMFDRYQCEIHTFDPSINPQVQVPEYVIFHKIGLGGKDSTVGPDKFDVRRFSTIVKQLDHEKRHIDILKIDIEGWEWAALSDIFVNGGLSRVRQLSLEIHFGTISDYQPKRKRMLTINSLQSLRKLLAADGSNDGKKRAIVHQITDKSNVDGMKKEVENMREQYKDKRAKGIELWSNDKKDSGFAHGNIATEEHEGVWGGVSFAFQLKVLRQLYEHGFRIFMREHNTFRVQTLPKPFWTFSNVNELSFLNLYDQFGSFDM
ncbi:uncharacterized protein LOC127832292 [Dreissena polymorpha]|nr:uncharacterized protein LOC127832292 [Dreissena polymorpha]